MNKTKKNNRVRKQRTIKKITGLSMGVLKIKKNNRYVEMKEQLDKREKSKISSAIKKALKKQFKFKSSNLSMKENIVLLEWNTTNKDTKMPTKTDFIIDDNTYYRVEWMTDSIVLNDLLKF